MDTKKLLFVFWLILIPILRITSSTVNFGRVNENDILSILCIEYFFISSYFESVKPRRILMKHVKYEKILSKKIHIITISIIHFLVYIFAILYILLGNLIKINIMPDIAVW